MSLPQTEQTIKNALTGILATLQIGPYLTGPQPTGKIQIAWQSVSYGQPFQDDHNSPWKQTVTHQWLVNLWFVTIQLGSHAGVLEQLEQVKQRLTGLPIFDEIDDEPAFNGALYPVNARFGQYDDQLSLYSATFAAQTTLTLPSP